VRTLHAAGSRRDELAPDGMDNLRAARRQDLSHLRAAMSTTPAEAKEACITIAGASEGAVRAVTLAEVDVR
jgi:hypothetical protein